MSAVRVGTKGTMEDREVMPVDTYNLVEDTD